MNYNYGKAFLTKKGILFKERYFTCERAIKEQWFVRTNNQDICDFVVLYEKNNIEFIQLLIGEELLTCRVIKQIILTQNQEYFMKLQHASGIY